MRKPFSTRGNVTVSNLLRMSDDSWRGLRLFERVRWARERAGLDTEEAATAAGVKAGTYRAYERDPETSSKWIAIPATNAYPLAKRLKVRWEWLLRGEGDPWAGPMDNEPTDRLKKIMLGLDPEEQERVVSAIESMLAIRR